MTESELLPLLAFLYREPREAEWIEFKHNNQDPQMIGERISALANAAALLGKERAWFVWGIEDGTYKIVGTMFKPRATSSKVGNEEMESWLSHHLSPCPDFHFHEFQAEGKPVVLLEIPPAQHTPVRWKETACIRAGSYECV